MIVQNNRNVCKIMNMNSLVDILESLEKTSSRLEKEDILKKNRDNDLLKRVIVAALDPYTTYGVAKVAVPLRYVKTQNLDETQRFENFLLLLEELSQRKLTGNSAKYTVVSHLAEMTDLERKWANRILLKNLRCGVQDSTANKVWQGCVKPFAVALADTLQTRPNAGGFDIVDEVKYPIAVQPKLDGLRCIAIKEFGKVTMYTRNGTILETAPKIKAYLESFEPFKSGVLDGELMAEDWNESASIVMSKKNSKDDSKLKFHVFDFVALEEWKNLNGVLSQALRRDVLLKIFANCDQLISVVDEYYVENESQLREAYANCLSFGYEGVMLKSRDDSYIFKRSLSILKLKPVSTWEGTVVGTYDGRLGGKREGVFGGFEVLLSNGIVTRVGSGFSDKLKAEVQLAGPESFIGKIVELEGQPDPLTADGLTRDGKVRFPVFTRFREPADVDQRIIETYDKWREQK